MFGTVKYSWYFTGVSEAAMTSSGCDDIPTEAETGSQVRGRRAVVTRRLVPLVGIAPVPFASSSHKRSLELLEKAFDNGMYHIRCGYFLVIHACSSFLVLFVSAHFSNDPVATPINATEHQFVTLCKSICAEERAQVLESLMSSKYYCRTIHVFSLACVHHFLDCSQDWMTFCAVWNAWNTAHRVLYLTHLRRLTLAAMIWKGVSPREESVRSGRLR